MKFLTPEQKKFYDDNGYVVLDLLTEEEISELSREFDQLFQAKANSNLEGAWKGDWKKDTKNKEVQSIHGLQLFSAAFTRLLLNANMLDACEDIMETPNILLHHTKAHSKPPGTGSPFPMHQDYHYFPYKKDSMIAVFVSLDASDPGNGGLCVYPGSHKLGPQEDVSNDPSFHYVDQKKFPIEKATPLTLKRGQIVIFSYLLIHGSYNNTSSDRVRRMYLIQLVAGEDVPLAAMHLSECQGMVLRGQCFTREVDIKKMLNEFLEQQKASGSIAEGNMKFLTPKQNKFYDDNGYVVLDLLTEREISELSEEFDELFRAKANSNIEATWQGDWRKDNKKMEVQSIHGLQLYSGAFTRLMVNEKVLDACEDIMGTPNILLHHTKAHSKPPGTGAPYPMHQDYHYFPYKKDSMIAVFVSLDASDPGNGGLCVYPGSHKLGPQEDVSTAPVYHYLDQKKFSIENATPLTLKRGQIVIFSYLLIHGSYNNTSDRVRRMYLIQLVSGEDVPLAAMHWSECQGMVLRGRCFTKEMDIRKLHEEFLEQQKASGR